MVTTLTDIRHEYSCTLPNAFHLTKYPAIHFIEIVIPLIVPHTLYTTAVNDKDLNV